MLRRVGLMLILSALSGSVAGCAWLEGLLKPPASEGRYLFIETWVQWHVEVVAGSFGLYIDFPTYSYDADRQTLDVMDAADDPKIVSDRSFLALWGDGTSLDVRNGTGGGVSSGVRGIYQLPFHRDGSFELLRIEPDGTAQLHFRGELLVLKPGESREAKTEPVVKKDVQSVIKESFTYRITNYGLWPKSKIRLAGVPLVH